MMSENINYFNTIIIGRGMMGSACARHLSLEQDGIALIGPDEPEDRKSHHGVFASHYDEARITRTFDDSPVWAGLAARSLDRYRALERDSGIGFFTEAGCLFTGASPEAFNGYLGRAIALGERLGLAIETLAPPVLDARFSAFRFPPGSSGYLESKRAGHVNPRRLVAAQSEMAKRQGVTIIAEHAVGVDDDDGLVRVTTASGATFSAGRILVAAGGFSNFNMLLPRPVAMRVSAMTVVFYEMDEARLALYGSMPSMVVMAEKAEDLVYILPPVRYPDGKVYLKVGSDCEARTFLEPEAIGDWFRSDGDPAERAHINRISLDLMPGLADCAATSAPCVASFTQTNLPYIGWTENPRIAVLSGGNFVAAKSSDELGRLGARLLMDGALDAADFGSLLAPEFL